MEGLSLSRCAGEGQAEGQQAPLEPGCAGEGYPTGTSSGAMGAAGFA